MDVERFLDGDEKGLLPDGGVGVQERDAEYEGDCSYCGGFVSEPFKRVFATNDGEIYACPGCASNSGIAEEQKRRMRNPEEYGLDA